MNLDWKTLFHLDRLSGKTFYLFYPDLLKSNLSEFTAAFREHYSQANVAFSYNASPIPDVCQIINENGGFAQVSSWVEYEIAKRVGVSPSKIIFTGAYKGDSAIARALNDGAIVIIDSYQEAMTIIELADKNPQKTYHVGFRVNITLENAAPSRFGLDVDSSAFRRIWNQISITKNIKIEGLHCHCMLTRKTVRAFADLTQTMILTTWQLFPEEPPTFIDIGGGSSGKS